MNRRLTRRFLLVCIGICLFILLFLLTLILLFPLLPAEDSPSSGATVSTMANAPTAPSIPLPTASRPIQPPPDYDGAIQTNAQEEPLFALTLDQFIVCHNHRFSQSMYPSSQWRLYPALAAPYTGRETHCYTYQADPNAHSYPTVQMYVCPETNLICEVSLPLSQHDWSQTLEQIYQRQAMRILAVFFPELSSDQLEALYAALFEDAHQNEYISHSQIPGPKTLRRAGSIGCYGYIYRGMICINLLPLNDARLAELSARGIQIVEIEPSR